MPCRWCREGHPRIYGVHYTVSEKTTGPHPSLPGTLGPCETPSEPERELTETDVHRKIAAARARVQEAHEARFRPPPPPPRAYADDEREPGSDDD